MFEELVINSATPLANGLPAKSSQQRSGGADELAATTANSNKDIDEEGEEEDELTTTTTVTATGAASPPCPSSRIQHISHNNVLNCLFILTDDNRLLLFDCNTGAKLKQINWRELNNSQSKFCFNSFSHLGTLIKGLGEKLTKIREKRTTTRFCSFHPTMG
jgi:hypothetical protein